MACCTNFMGQNEGKEEERNQCNNEQKNNPRRTPTARCQKNKQWGRKPRTGLLADSKGNRMRDNGFGAGVVLGGARWRPADDVFLQPQKRLHSKTTKTVEKNHFFREHRHDATTRLQLYTTHTQERPTFGHLPHLVPAACRRRGTPIRAPHR